MSEDLNLDRIREGSFTFDTILALCDEVERLRGIISGPHFGWVSLDYDEESWATPASMGEWMPPRIISTTFRSAINPPTGPEETR